MANTITYDENLIEEIANKFDLRTPNIEALKALVHRIETGDFNPLEPLVLNLATAVGKTYILASLIEYLRHQDFGHVMVVTPSTVVQDKTVRDLSEGSQRYIGGFDIAPTVVTPTAMQALAKNQDMLTDHLSGSMVYVFNVQQLFPPKPGGKNEASGVEAGRRKVYRFQEETGVLADRLINLKDLVVIADESHLFGTTAKVFRESLTNLKPAVTVGLTASPDKKDDVIYRYPLWRAIEDGYVKQPVLVYRTSGYDSEERQLQDAVNLLRYKEENYATYRAVHPDKPQTKPLLFVVCSDVNHATETATLLRNTHLPDTSTGPQVLQVDHQHDDDTTRTFLRNLDSATSSIRAIVSVNKLREGWDTKRIAVMCTLRAMGSDVLTQQVMGRGLRLPFGEITGIEEIDQLDIISHKSFVNLLQNEKVLREFGIEEEEMPAPVIVDPDTDSTGDGTDASTGSCSGSNTTPTPAPTVRGLTDDEPIVPPTPQIPVVVKINPNFTDTSFMFPTSVMTETQKSFKLSEIEQSKVVAQAIKVKDTDEQLERRKLVADIDNHELIPEELDRMSVQSFQQSETSVARELTNRVLNTRGVAQTQDNVTQLVRIIVPTFMKSATCIKQWTEKSKESAVRLLTELIAEEAKAAIKRNTSLDVNIVPTRLPVAQQFVLPVGTVTHTRLDMSKKNTGFVRNQYYGTWKRGLFEYARFDSFSAEYKLAYLFNLDPRVKWWTRIYDGQGAKIAYTTRNHYVPDFVVCDMDGTYWIVEGKADSQRHDETVHLKRKAAEQLIRELVGHPAYAEQRWGYIIAYESDIANASSLADLSGSSFVVGGM
jgi:DNA restriction-modification system, restriction enzyme